MIRPITCLAVLAACGSGLYLYQEKHRVHVLDHQIAAIAHQTDKLREQTSMLRAEWMVLNNPDRLRRLANQFLPNLHAVSPSQYTTMADLNSRLPPVQLPPPVASAPGAGVPVAQAAPATPAAQAAPTAATAQPAAPAAVAQAATPAKPATPAVQSAPTAATAQPAAPAAVAQAATPAKVADRTTAPQQVAAAAPPAPAVHPATVRPHPAVPHVAHSRDVRSAPHATDHPIRQARLQARDRPRNTGSYPERHYGLPRPVAVTAQQRFVRPMPSAPYAGSMLGMAHEQPTVPAPTPMQSNLMNVGG